MAYECGHERLGQGTTWREMPPGEMHRYKVTCNVCRKQLMWGAERDLQSALDAHPATKVLPYTPPATLDAFFSDEA